MYAELHCLSNFSFLRGASHPGELIERAIELGYEALALTDECSMAGVVRAYEAARARQFKLIVGAEFKTADGLHIVLLAPTQTAYAQICALITLGRRRSDKGSYRLLRSDFEMGLDECLALWIPADASNAVAAWLRSHFESRCWLAVELHREAGDAERLSAFRALAQRTGIPLIAAGNVHMHARDRRPLQDTVTAIRHGCTVAQAGYRLFANDERHLRTLADLSTLYPRNLLDATLEVAARCEFSLGSLQYNYPRELVPEAGDATRYLRSLVLQGMKVRWPLGASYKIRKTIAKELKLIAKLKYEPFFLTVHDIVRYAKEKQILCQGRGSSANSIVCYALGITAADPRKIGLLFGRFLSEERAEPPDIDVDFEHERREEVIQYVYNKYGRERAAIAATVITYRSRSATRDVGKALGLAPDTVDQIAKMQAYWDREEEFEQHLKSAGLRLDMQLIGQLCFLVKALRGFPRHLSQHVGGFVIADEPISHLVPIENAAMPERTIIQWDKDDLETLGLLKVDVLALGMLTVLRRTFDLLRDTEGAPRNVAEIPDDDAETYDMICAADTVGVFQIESRAQMSMLPRLRPRTYYDLVVEVAIVRPGPIEGGMVHPYLKARRDPDSVEYPSPALKEVLKRTLGVPIFQEQVMQIAVVAAGFTVGEADQLRRSMAAWQRSGDMGRFKTKLIDGMLARQYSLEFAERIFRQIEGFAEYGFPESHSASFALLTYYSSYLKKHYPAAFFAALVNSQPMGFYEPRQLLETARRSKVIVLPIDVQVSEWYCTLERSQPQTKDTAAIRLGMCLVRDLREPEASAIVTARRVGRFRSTDDLAHRAALPARAIKALALANALLDFTVHRHAAVWTALGVEKLPGMLAGASANETTPSLPAPSAWEEVVADYHRTGVSPNRHPMQLLRRSLHAAGICSRADLNSIPHGRRVKVCGLITHLQHPETANGVVFASLEDEFGIHNIIFWPDVFDANRYALLKATAVVVHGTLQNQENVVNVLAERVEDYTPRIGALTRHSRDFR
jgi:error-prone DNA polymerase